MADKPVKPIESYPDVEPEDHPPVPPSEPEGEAAAEPSAAPPEVALLDFVDGGDRVVKLERPFRLDGVVVAEITVRRLTVSAVAELSRAGKVGDLYEVYSAMTGLPASVLRGLDAGDGLEVTGAAWDFLPRRIREIHQPASTST
jgi:hypothetical protein